MSHDAALHARRARSFGAVADEYERIRPGYPDALVDDVVAYTHAGPAARVLDVGAGTGKGTKLLVARGLDVTALEPDPGMLAAGRRAVPGARWVLGTLEQAPVRGPFDVLTSAQAWHWTDQSTCWSDAVGLLRPGGVIALWWNHSALASAETSAGTSAETSAGAGASTGVDAAAVVAAYARHAPGIESDVLGGPLETAVLADADGWPADVMRTDLRLLDVELRTYAWSRTLDRDDYLALLDTQSPYRVLPDADRAALFDGLAAVLPPVVTLDMVTTLHLARTVDSAPPR